MIRANKMKTIQLNIGLNISTARIVMSKVLFNEDFILFHQFDHYMKDKCQGAK